MKDDRRRGDERNDRGRAGRDVTRSRRSVSPPPRRPREGGRSPSDSRPFDLLPEKLRHQPSSRQHDRGRDRRPRPASISPSRRGGSTSGASLDRPRGPDRDRPDHQPRRKPSNTQAGSPSKVHGGPPSSPSTKRHRSRSPSPGTAQRKKFRRDGSPSRDQKGSRPDHGKRGRNSSRQPSRRSPSPGYRESISKHKYKKPPHLPGRRSPSPGRRRIASRGDHIPSPRHPDPPRHRHRRSRSPDSIRQGSPKFRASPGPPPPGRLASPSRRTRDLLPSHKRPSDTRSRNRSSSAGSGRRARPADDRSSSKNAEHASEGNSAEVNMSGRGNYRGSYNPHQQMPAAYPPNHHRYSQSPQQGTPNSSYHGSPNQSPYGAGRGGWGGQYSPQHQYPPQYPQGNYGPSHAGPQGHYSSNSSFSATPPAPAGPMQQFPQGTSRGNYRGGGGFRGGYFNSNRGAYRGNNFKSGQWNSSNPSSGTRGNVGASDDGDSAANPRGKSDEDEAMIDAPEPEESDSRSAKDVQSGNAAPDKNGDSNMPPPGRPPPSGPGSQSGASSKFSFAFKASKPAATAPKPEISQKFNAAPQRRDGGGRVEHESREPPRSAPTEPASARARQEPRAQPPPPPQSVPRTRKVKKRVKRLKPRPALTADLVSSESVFYRKPGNESVVGSGTYGKVFKALHVYTKGLVALKRIRMEGERDGFPVTAVREIKLLQSLKHENIVQLQEVMVEKNDCFMVFEYLSHDLTGLLNHPSFKLDSAQKKHLALQLFEGLDYLHKRGVLHRDIKAANILVSSDGILKLADFGLARFYAKRHQLDYTNRVITIWYRSPELLLGETQYGPGCDVWSAACVMVEIFTRHAIFPGDGGEINQLDKIYAVLGTPNKAEWPALVDMPWFELLRPGYRRASTFAEKYKDRVSPAAYDLLAAMFRYDPATRPNAAEVLSSPYFTVEDPPPRQAIELQNLDGDWHEFESKALRRENERKDREARRQAGKESSKPRDKKRENEAHDRRGDSKRLHLESKADHAVAAGGSTKA